MLITLARKPLTGSVVQNVLAHGCGALNVDGTRIATSEQDREQMLKMSEGFVGKKWGRPELANYGYEASMPDKTLSEPHSAGRWPANIVLDPTPDVLAHFPEVKGQVGMTKTVGGHRFIEGDTTTVQKFDHGKTDTGSAARFFKQIQGD